MGEVDQKKMPMSELDEIEAVALGPYPSDDDLLGLLLLALVHNEADRNDHHFIACGALRLLREKKSDGF